ERQRRENLVAQREPMSARDAELVELITVRNGDIAMYETKLARQAHETRESELLITDHAAQRKQAEAGAAKIAEQRATQFAAISHAEADLRHLRDSLGELQDRRGQRQVRESQLQMKIDHLADHVSRSYQVDLRAFVVDESAFGSALRAQAKKWMDRPAGDDTNGSEAASSLPSRSENTIQLSDNEIEKLIRDLRTQLDNMGPVNLDAVHEYDELEERYKFLEAQNTDLTNSRRELLDVIAQINSTTRKLFSETFAQVRTRPFCILDEVDAAMDEGNINRFVRMLERFVEQSQFIIITHNKRTIAKADVLYGVTMEERGVSKLVGMKLTAQQVSTEVSSI